MHEKYAIMIKSSSDLETKQSEMKSRPKIKVKCFYDDALTELVNHYANRTLIVSCTKDYTKI